MIVVDTNVFSEGMRLNPDRRVKAWLKSRWNALAITAVSLGELQYGAERLPPGDKRDRLLAAIARLEETLSADVLPYDVDAARGYAFIRSRCERLGRPMSVPDAMITGICAATGSELATRNTKDFECSGVALTNPWESVQQPE